MIPDLVTVGGLTVDNVIAADGRVALARAGGNGAYSAVGALMWQPRVGLVSAAVATYPRETINRLESGGVDLGGVAWSDAHLAACNWFIYDESGRREEGLTSPPEALAEAGFPTRQLSAGQIARWREMLIGRDAPDEVSYSEFRNRHPLSAKQIPQGWHAARGVLLAPSQPDVMLAMLDHFGPGGGMVIADPGWQLADRRLDDIAPLLARLDAFLPSEVELRALVPDTGLAEALAVLAGYCPGALAVKLGAAGALVWDRVRRTPVQVPAAPATTVDPTGAGDSFCGGFLAGFVETGDPVQAARFGAISAAQIVQHFGADGALPADRAARRAELDKEVVPCP
jgi:ribokinase